MNTHKKHTYRIKRFTAMVVLQINYGYRFVPTYLSYLPTYPILFVNKYYIF